MKKFWIILPIVIVLVAGTVLGLYAAGVFKKSGEEETPTALAKEVTASASESNVFRELSENTYFDIKASQKPNNDNFDNYVRITDSKGEKVGLVVDNNVKLEDGYMTISATKGLDRDKKDKNGKIIRQERYAGAMQRSFYVGEGVKTEDVKAKFEDGVLKLDIPKKEMNLPGNNTINIEG